VRRIEPNSARKELLRYLRLGKSVRLRGGENLVRNFILEAQADPAIRRLCLAYHLNVSDLSLACSEILAEGADLILPEDNHNPSPLQLFSNPRQLEEFLKKLQRATYGQTVIQRSLAIVACAKLQAAQMANRISEPQRMVTRSHLLKISLLNNIFVMMLVAGLILVGALIAIFLR